MKPLCYDLHDGTGRVYKSLELIPAFKLLPERMFKFAKNKEVTLTRKNTMFCRNSVANQLQTCYNIQ